ncbi:hypothetical protein DSL72_005453 [Monilinia vaccinii-corymbosi]|uniref:Carrier domain-containing protein n=1 Tax=Monilinia vaccinii-corymbosi TaxID=61207 RepID=A0A8A3PFP0_9HELO|nr:hypothetical protein DSL72_005453 [Monilinia vaccinii-corymbosi]
MGSVQGQTPAYGQRLVPIMLDEQATNNPDRIIYSLAKTAKAADGFVDISMKRLANSVNRAAWWIEKLLGKGNNFPSVGYTGPGDLRYHILTLALVKAGYKIVLSSPRNTVEGHLNIIRQAECSVWLLPSHGSSNITEVLKVHPMTVLDCPELDFFIDETLVPHYAYNKTWAEACTEPFLVLHTSGSTGLPKIIVMGHALGASIDAQHLLKCKDGEELQWKIWPGARIFSTFPAFHSAAIFFTIFCPFYREINFVFASPSVPVTSNLVDDMVEHANINALMIAPPTFEELASSPSSLELLQKKNIKFITTGGGPVGKKAGDTITKITTVHNLIGSTEAGLYAQIWTGREDWQYFHFHPDNGAKFVEREGGVYEMLFVRNPKLQHVQGIFHTFPELNEFSTKDRYEKHPTRPDLWLYRGRADDVIVLSNGEKLNPVTMELTINEHPDVRAAIVVGQARFQPALIIELNDSVEVTEGNKKDLIRSIQPFIDTANRGSPSHGQIKDGFVTFAKREKPFQRVPKGSLQRGPTIQLYESEIEELFANTEDDDDIDLQTSSLDSLTISLKGLITKIAHVDDLDVNVDIFATGSFDSLSVFTLLRQLRSAFKKDSVKSQKLQASTIYNNPTAKSLALALYKLVHPSENQEDASKTTFDERQQIFEKYAKDLPTKVLGSTAKDSTSQISVILTGSTGSMGSYILDGLVSLPHISKIYALNRAVDGERRQRGVSDSHGLKTDFSKVRFFKTDMSQPRFGLDQEKYDELLSNTTHIIHNQWQVDFNLSLASFEHHVGGVRNLIDFAAAGKHNAILSFISSVGVTQGKKWENPVPELIIDDWNAAAMGYGSSKLISEVLLAEAQKVGGVRTQVLRVGQISGPFKNEAGRWNIQEWFPTIVSTSQYMKSVPKKLAAMDRIDWVPIDVLSDVIIDLADLSNPSETSTGYPHPSTPFYHLVNPTSIRWSDIRSVLVEDIGSQCQIVEWSEWVNRLRASAERGEIKENRGIKLLEFYDRMENSAPLATLETDKTVEKSEALGKVGPVNEDWLKLWMRQWRA